MDPLICGKGLNCLLMFVIHSFVYSLTTDDGRQPVASAAKRKSMMELNDPRPGQLVTTLAGRVIIVVLLYKVFIVNTRVMSQRISFF